MRVSLFRELSSHSLSSIGEESSSHGGMLRRMSLFDGIGDEPLSAIAKELANLEIK
jgi:hypothetical protein